MFLNASYLDYGSTVSKELANPEPLHPHAQFDHDHHKREQLQRWMDLWNIIIIFFFCFCLRVFFFHITEKSSIHRPLYETLLYIYNTSKATQWGHNLRDFFSMTILNVFVSSIQFFFIMHGSEFLHYLSWISPHFFFTFIIILSRVVTTGWFVISKFSIPQHEHGRRQVVPIWQEPGLEWLLLNWVCKTTSYEWLDRPAVPLDFCKT